MSLFSHSFNAIFLVVYTHINGKLITMVDFSQYSKLTHFQGIAVQHLPSSSAMHIFPRDFAPLLLAWQAVPFSAEPEKRFIHLKLSSTQYSQIVCWFGL